MEFETAIRPEQIEAFRRQYAENAVSRVAAHAASSANLEQVCYNLPCTSKMNHKFSLEVPTMKGTDQKSSGRCWIFASLNVLREKIGRELNLEEFELSQNYIAFYDHLEKANTFLQRMIDTADRPLDDRLVYTLLGEPVGDGGWWEYFVGLCKKYGIVPKEAMPETFQSTHSNNMNVVLNMQLRKNARQLRRALAEGQPVQDVMQQKQEMLAQVYNLLAICLGEPPRKFDFEYVDKEKHYHAERGLDPHAFYDKYIGRDLDAIVSIVNAPTPDLPYYKTYYTEGEESVYGGYQAKRLNLPMDEFKAAVIRQLTDGDLVWFVCDCDYYCNTDKGIWDPDLYDFGSFFGIDLEMEKGDLLWYRQCSLNHAMVLTGVNLVDGKPDKWKVQNSWGTDDGKDGYFIMSDAWFDRYVFTASIDKKYLTEAQRHCFEEEAQLLPIWNILA